MDTFTPTLLVTILIVMMGRATLAGVIRALNWWVWDEDLPVPRRRLVGLLVAVEATLPLLIAGSADGLGALLASQAGGRSLGALPTAILVALAATLPAYGLFLALGLKTTFRHGIAIQTAFLAAVATAWGVIAVLSTGLGSLLRAAGSG